MKTICFLLFALLAKGTSHQAGVLAKADTNEHKPCVDLKASPADEEDTAAFKAILDAQHVDLVIFLYVSRDPMVKNHGGAMSFRCKVDNHEFYDADENWTIYDPDLIQGDAARDFVFAHEIAHHLDGDTTSGRPRSKEVESRADYNGAKYLLQMGWNGARLLHALDLLNLPQSPLSGYPTLKERKANIESAALPPGPSPPTNLQATVIASQSPSYGELWGKLLNLTYQGGIEFQSVRSNKYVCAIGTPDPKIPSARHFAFFDNCEQNSHVSFDLRISPDGKSGYWIQQHEDPCPPYAAFCGYALESVGNQLQFWNQNLAADGIGWEKELGEQEIFTIEASDLSEGQVRIKLHSGGYIFVDPSSAKLQGGGSREQATEFKILFEH